MSDEREQERGEPLNVYDMVMVSVEQFASLAWQKLGLQPDIVTGRIAQDLPQAKVAIDLAAHMAGLLEPQLDDADKRRLSGLVTDLRLNYVQQTRETGA